MSSTSLKSAFGDIASHLAKQQETPQKSRLTRVMTRAGQWFHGRRENDEAYRPPRLRLDFPDRFVDFRSLREFEFALNSRTEFPAARVRRLIDLTPLELEKRASGLRRIEREFADILARALQNPEFTGEYFREIELKLFSDDHGWRETMESLIRLSPAYDPYKHIALIKYMQYLRARQNIMRSVFIEITKHDDNACIHAARKIEDSTPSACSAETSTFRSPQTGPGEVQIEDGTVEDADSYCALAKGETTTLRLGEEREVELLLAGNRVRLYTGRKFYIVDDDNNAHPLHAGQNMIGRHSACDVVLDPACRAVSRKHLIVQVLSPLEVQLTDLSAHGTEVPAHLLYRH